MAGYISEFQYIGGTTVEFIEIAVPTGTDVSSYTLQVYASDGTVAHTYSLGTVQSTVWGQDVYVIDQTTSGFADIQSGEALALVDDTGTVDQFISFGGATVTATSGDANGLTSTSVGSVGFGQTLESNDGGTSYSAQSSPNSGTIPCFAAGTLIETPDGPVPVESLAAGDMVVTRDRGAQEIRWRSCRAQQLGVVRRDKRPVLIQAGALGPGLPDRDMIVSPQHRILVGSSGQLTGAFAREALTPAKALTGLPGIRHMMGRETIHWYHFACDRHEIVRANGCWSESLLLGKMVVDGMPGSQRRAVAALFRQDGLTGGLNGPAARPLLSVGEASRSVKAARRTMQSQAAFRA